MEPRRHPLCTLSPPCEADLDCPMGGGGPRRSNRLQIRRPQPGSPVNHSSCVARGPARRQPRGRIAYAVLPHHELPQYVASSAEPQVRMAAKEASRRNVGGGGGGPGWSSLTKGTEAGWIAADPVSHHPGHLHRVRHSSDPRPHHGTLNAVHCRPHGGRLPRPSQPFELILVPGWRHLSRKTLADYEGKVRGGVFAEGHLGLCDSAQSAPGAIPFFFFSAAVMDRDRRPVCRRPLLTAGGGAFD